MENTNTLNWVQIFTVAVPVLVAVVTGFWLWFSGRKKVGAEAQTTITVGFQTLVTELQEERKDLMSVIEKQGEKIDLQMQKISEQSNTIHGLRNEVFALTRSVKVLTFELEQMKKARR